jgi:hypothetical protein
MSQIAAGHAFQTNSNPETPADFHDPALWSGLAIPTSRGGMAGIQPRLNFAVFFGWFECHATDTARRTGLTWLQ